MYVKQVSNRAAEHEFLSVSWSKCRQPPRSISEQIVTRINKLYSYYSSNSVAHGRWFDSIFYFCGRFFLATLAIHQKYIFLTKLERTNKNIVFIPPLQPHRLYLDEFFQRIIQLGYNENIAWIRHCL